MDEIIFLEETTSTNDWLKARCNELSGGACVVADRQTSGKGRRGHTWETAQGMLAMSVLLKNSPELDTLTARIGLAVCDAIERLCPDVGKIGIKWPNDIIISNRKVCGILCESTKIGECVNVICGIGVNISQSEEYFKSAALLNATSLKLQSKNPPEKNALCREIRKSVLKRAEKRFCDCFEEYKARVVNIGREVKIITPGAEKTAFAADIAENGSLICEDENGRFEVSAGEVSVRGTEGYI